MPKARATHNHTAKNGVRGPEPANVPEVGAQPAETAVDATQSGADARRRGWFWHWNSMVTQYAPLLGLKGIGLLNSYTVWTDRREHSPYHGYAFPSQTSEAAFYGEDRAELITINKILVALDLIEIRKEMVQRTDEQGRRWRVPHNFYRVKDRTDGLDLRSADVLRVVELASADKAVFRYIRRIFSSKFAPIDEANAWHAILTELSAHPTWRALSAQAAELEARNSARSKAGHRRRAGSSATPPADVEAILMTDGQLDAVEFSTNELGETPSAAHATVVGAANNGSTGLVGLANSGCGGVADATNTGLDMERLSSVAEINDAPRSSVEPSNTMYYQAAATTTTTTAAPAALEECAPTTPADLSAAPLHLEATGLVEQPPHGDASAASGRPAERGAHHAGGGPLGDPSALVVSLFEAANDRRASKLERVLLSELEHAADAAARAAGSTGADWVAAALREAVASGSAFVAPKRIREILNRWAAEGAGPAGGVTATPASAPADAAPPTRRVAAAWQRTLAAIRRTVDESTFDRLFSSSEIITLRGDTAAVRVATDAVADKLGHEYRALVERNLSQAAGRTMHVHFIVDAEPATPVTAESEPAAARYLIPAADAERGRQLWTAVLAALGADLPAADVARLAAVTPLGQGPDGALLLGVPNRLAARLIEGRCRPAIEAAFAGVLGAHYALQTIERADWAIAG